MTEQNSTTTAPGLSDAEIVVQPTRLQKFVNKHPRAANIIALVGGGLAVGGVANVTHTARKNSHHLASAADHLSEAGAELSSAVSPTSETTA